MNFSDLEAEMEGTQTTLRDRNGRFAAGCSGNPAGKRKGTRNRATLLAEALRDGEGEAVARIVIDKALAGDAVAARFCLTLLSPKPRGRAITLDLPEGCRPGDVVAAFNITLAAMAAGEITPDEALVITRVLDGRLRALKAWQLEEKLTSYGRTIPGDEIMLAEEDALSLADVEESAPDTMMSPAPPPEFAEDLRVTADLNSTCISPESHQPSPSPPLGGEGRGEEAGAAFPLPPEKSHPVEPPPHPPFSPKGARALGLAASSPFTCSFPAFHPPSSPHLGDKGSPNCEFPASRLHLQAPLETGHAHADLSYNPA
jgi:hypothetical protein